MRILFVHEVGYLEKPIFEMHEFPEYLSKLGHVVAFLDMPDNATQTSYFGKSLAGRAVPGSSLRLYSKNLRVKSTLGRLLATLDFSRFFASVLDDFNPQVIVCLAVPTSGWQSLLIARKRGTPFVFRALDVSHKIRRTLFSPAVKFAEKFIYRNADWVSCNNPAMLQYCLSMGARPQLASVELPPLELSHFVRPKKNDKMSIRRNLGVDEKATVIVYMGTFFYFSGLDVVLQDLAEVSEKPHLVLIGGGEQGKALRRLVGELGLADHVTFAGFVSFSELPSFLGVADVAINPMLPSLVAHAALPNKVLQYMANGLPVVSTHLRGLASLFGDTPGLVLVQDSNQVLESAISLANSSDLESLGESNRELVSSRFDVDENVLAFETLVSKVGGIS